MNTTENNIAGERTHSPGPWKWQHERGTHDRMKIVDSEGFLIAGATFFLGERECARVGSNCRLIAASPDLLEAAKGALKVLNPATAGVFYENLKAAIAKAESC